MEKLHCENTEKQRTFIIRFIYGAIIALCVYASLKWALPVLFPFVLATLFAVILNKPVRFLSQRFHLNRHFTALPILLLFFGLLGILAMFASSEIVSGMGKLVSLLSGFMDTTIFPTMDKLITQLSSTLKDFAPTAQLNFSDILPAFQKGFSAASSWLLNVAATVASSIPALILKTVITVIATSFMVIDYDTIKIFIAKQLPTEKQQILNELRSFAGDTLPKCLGSYAIIMVLTFIELLSGFLLLKISNPVLWAMLIAVIDILPVLGTGSILIPWGIFELIMGNYGMGAGILVLYLVITIIRNTVEPKLVGKQMELHPLLTFAAMLLGLKLIGFVGMLGLPLTLAFINSLNKKGIIHLYK